MSRLIDLTGSKFNRLTVVERDYEKEKELKGKISYWKCVCDCGNTKSISSSKLRSGNTKSCGCLNKEMIYKRSKKFNDYDLFGDYGIGYTSKGDKFYFDLEDYDIIKEHCWYFNNVSYVATHVGDKTVLLHRFVMNAPDDMLVDHSDGNKFDNRKNNLRFATKAQNCQNSKLSSNNTSGRKGVLLHKNGSWGYEIQYNNNKERKYGFKTFEDAVIARELAEKKFHKEFTSYEYRVEEK